MRITRRGVLLLAAAPVLSLLAWLLGLPEAAILAMGAVIVVVAAYVWVLTHRPDLDVRRSARPARCTVGDACQIQLQTRNRATRRSPVVVLHDDVGRHGSAQLHLGPLDPGAGATATYSLPTERRGLHRVGPLTSTVTDPFGLARSTEVDLSRITVIVLPRTWPLTPLPAAPGDEPEQGVRALTSLSTVDEEFSTLRAYVPGDDIRRIHWPTTARTGTPVMREFELPWQHRTTIVLDRRAGAHRGNSFERAVSVAASLVELAAARGELVRLITTGSAPSADARRQGPDDTTTGFVSAGDRLDPLMDRLAGVTTWEPAPLPAPLPGPAADGDRAPSAGATSLVERVRQLGPSATGRLVICTGDPDGAERLELEQVSSRFGLRILVSTGAAPMSAPGDAPTPSRTAAPSFTPASAATSRSTATSLVQIRWDGRAPLDQVWSETVRTGSSAPGPSTVRPSGTREPTR